MNLPRHDGLLECGQSFVEVWTRTSIRSAYAREVDTFISYLAQVYGLIEEGNIEEAQEFCRGAAEMFTQNVVETTKSDHSSDLAEALRDLLDVVGADQLIPESVSYMKRARAALADWEAGK